MDVRDIPHRRLRNLRLAGPPLDTAADVVDRLCAVQAQDYPGAKWALGARSRGATDADVESAFDAGAILRTHLLRPTWHFIRPADIRWLLALTAPRVRAAMAYRRRQLELDAKTLRRTNRAIERALRDGAGLTRDELRTVLRDAGVKDVGLERMTHIMMTAELDGIVCSGPRRGKQFTYALLDHRAPPARPLARDEALATLAGRYFASRGPATVQDFAKWAGLTVADGRAGLAAVESELVRERIDGRDYWLAPARRPPKPRSPSALLLSIYDEYVSSYKDRSAIVSEEHGPRLVGMGNALTSIVVLEGRIAGTWKRRLGPRSVRVEISYFEPVVRTAERAVEAEARRYGEFLGLDVDLA